MILQKSLAAILATILTISRQTCAQATFNSLQDFVHATSPENEKITFIKFYAPWCGHCKHMAPAWKQLADRFAENDNVMIASVDCTVSKNYCDRQGVRGFPTLKLFVKGVERDFKGARDLDGMDSFVRKAMQDPVTNRYIPDNGKTQFILLSSDPQHAENFRRVADEFYLTDGLEFINENHPSDANRILVSNHGSPQIAVSALDIDSIKQTIQLEAFPLWTDLSARSFAATAWSDYRQGRKLFLAGPDSIKLDHIKELANQRTYQSKLIFGSTDEKVVNYFHITMDSKYGMAIFDPKTQEYWVLNEKESVSEQCRVILSGHRAATGGKPGFFKKIKHGIEDLFDTLGVIGNKHPVLMVLMVGIPIGLCACLSYAIFFMGDTTEFEGEDERLLIADEDSGEIHEMASDRGKQERERVAMNDQNLRARRTQGGIDADDQPESDSD